MKQPNLLPSDKKHYGCWYHIQYVIKVLWMNWFIYSCHQIVLHPAWLMRSPILQQEKGGGGGGGGGSGVGLVGVVMLRHGCGLCSKWEGGGRVWGWWWSWEGAAGGRGGNNRAKQNKEGTENNLKLCIDLALVIVHIFHSPTGPISVSLKCKGRRKENEKKKRAHARKRLATHTVGGNVPYIEVYWSCRALPLESDQTHKYTQTHTGAQSDAGGGHDRYAWQ